jgi:hypothetical protein
MDDLDEVGESDESNNTDRASGRFTIESSYWEPEEDTDSRPGLTVLADEVVPLSDRLELEVEVLSESAMQLRVCKESGSFSSEIWLGIAVTGTVSGAFPVELTPSGRCSSWLELSVDDYAAGDTVDLTVTVVSPSTSASSWDTECDDWDSDVTGSCWTMSTSTFTRTCRE